MENIQADVADDMEMVDGYDELGPEDQARVRTAISEGHIADEDCTSIVRSSHSKR